MRLRLVTSIFYLYQPLVTTMSLWCEVESFVTANVSVVQTQGPHHPMLTYHKANIKYILIEDITKSLSCNEVYIVIINFSTHYNRDI